MRERRKGVVAQLRREREVSPNQPKALTFSTSSGNKSEDMDASAGAAEAPRRGCEADTKASVCSGGMSRGSFQNEIILCGCLIFKLRFSAESVSNKRGGMIRLFRRSGARDTRGPRARMRVRLRVNFFDKTVEMVV
jgi:hypothetical protein